VLIADDDPSIRRLLMEILSRNGFSPVLAENGFQACEVARRDRPDIVLLDLRLPGRSGDEVLSDLRSRRETERIPVLFISGDELDDDDLRAAGAQGFVPKPFRMETLVACIRHALAS
jgi:DNA-binding response OmpR family regulator